MLISDDLTRGQRGLELPNYQPDEWGHEYSIRTDQPEPA